MPGGQRKQWSGAGPPPRGLFGGLEQGGIVEGTLGNLGGQFGRNNYSEGQVNADNYGRDHHPRCFSMWMAGGGVRGGVAYGETCPFGYHIVENPVHVREFHATLLHTLGVDH